MSMYDPKNPALDITLELDEKGKVCALVFTPRKRQLTDGIHPDELEDRAVQKRTNTVFKSKPDDPEKRQIRYGAKGPWEGELSSELNGRKRR